MELVNEVIPANSERIEEAAGEVRRQGHLGG